MESTNGTKVNGQKVSIVELKDGDRITAGKTVLLITHRPVPVGAVDQVLRLGASARQPG